MPDVPEPEAVEPAPESAPAASQPFAKVEPAEAPPETDAESRKYHFLKWWTFLMVLLPVWIPAVAAGLGLYYWWIHSFDKTWPQFVVLVFVIGCTVAALLLAMAGQRPLVAALAIAVMTAPFAAAVGVAPMHGTYYCTSPLKPRCFVELVPY